MAECQIRGYTPKNYAVVAELLLGLTEYFIFYNSERFHQALSYKTPNEVYLTGVGGGVKIVDQSVINGLLQKKKWDSANLL